MQVFTHPFPCGALAYDIVTLTKLSILSAETLNQLLDELGKGRENPKVRLKPGSNNYKTLFMRQIGER